MRLASKPTDLEKIRPRELLWLWTLLCRNNLISIESYNANPSHRKEIILAGLNSDLRFISFFNELLKSMGNNLIVE